MPDGDLILQAQYDEIVKKQIARMG
jgi:hypothetical protein